MGVRFKLLDDKEREDISSIRIISSEVIKDKMPFVFGPKSPFTGTDNNRIKCATCKQGSRNCIIGHYGHISGFPAFNPYKQIMIKTKKVLSILCHNSSCYRLVFSSEAIMEEMKKPSRNEKDNLLTHLYNIIHTTPGLVCYHCKTPVRYIEDNPEFPVIFRYKVAGIYNLLYPIEVYELLNKTSVDEFNRFFPEIRPSTLCTKNVLVPGLPFRVDMISVMTNKPEINPLTSAIISLISYCQSYDNLVITKSSEMDDITRQNMDGYLFLLKYLVIGNVMPLSGSLINNNKILSTVIKFLTKKIPTGFDNIAGKEGTIRGRQMAKRIGNIARGVVTCNSRIPFGHVALPINIMSRLYHEEKFTSFNRIRLLVHYNNGSKFPGANYLIRAIDNEKLIVDNIKDNYVPVDGDILIRHIAPGDRVILIRQPTLNLSNITSYIIDKDIDPNSMAIGVNPEEYANLKGGDFDGDESPVIAMSDYNGISELTELLPTHEYLVNVKNTNVMIGADNNSAMGIALLTMNNEIPKAMFHKLIYGIKLIDTEKYIQLVKKKTKLYTGREIVSLLLPKGIYYRNTPGWYSP
ncbi:MAG: hypothetical protein KDH96_09145, partial [Candidatus Riesia sp.]|nr:hypothetical protein [Candidatus Riesia sp.]